MSHHCRCRVCGARQALRKSLDTYCPSPQCRNCGERKLRPDSWMNNRNTKVMTCSCSGHGLGYTYPHRRGALWCNFQPNGEWKTYEKFVDEARRGGDPNWEEDQCSPYDEIVA